MLGRNDPELGVKMRTSTATYPVWTSVEPVAVVSRDVVQYKYAVFSGGSFDRWETFEGDQAARFVVVDPAALEPKADGSPGDTLAVDDAVACEGLGEWTREDARRLRLADTSVEALAAASKAGAHADGGGDPTTPEGKAVRFSAAADRSSEVADREAFRAATERAESPRVAAPKQLAAEDLSPRGQRAAAQRRALESFIGREAPPPGVGAHQSLDVSDGVVVVSLFLPVLITRDASGGLDVAWDYENLLSLEAPLRVTRVGVARVPGDATEDEKAALAARLRRAPWCSIAIFLEEETFRLFYHSFCKGILWPVFHNSLEVFGEQSTPLLEYDDIYEYPRDEGAQDAPGALLAATGSAQRLDRDVKIMRSVSSSSFSEVDPIAEAADLAEAARQLGSFQSRPSTGSGSDGLDSSSGTRATAKSAPRGRVTTKDEQAWHAYKRVNQIFRDYVVEAYNEGDLVWIHGFQLALLPAFVSRRLTVAKVGIFLHTPFPSSEIFRTLSMRSELLRGILSADQIGFHLYEYARHFMTNCRRLLGTKYEFDARGAVLDVDGRDVVISCVHAGVEPTVLSRVSASPEGARAFENLRRSLPATAGAGAVTRVIAGIDKIERLRGLPLKLLAYERFLEGAAARRAAGDFAEDEGAGGDRTCLVQYALTSFERQADCDKIRRDCRVLVERIKAKHGADVLYWHEFFEVPIHDRLALLAVADVFWVSSVRDGLNRWPLEYVAMQYETLMGTEIHGDVEAALGVDGAQHQKYLDDALARMLDCNGGPGYPCADPSTNFFPKTLDAGRAKRRGLEERELADAVFPTADVAAAAAAAAGAVAAAEATADKPNAGCVLVKPRHYVAVNLGERKMEGHEVATLAELLASGAFAKSHAARRGRCAGRRVGALLLSDNASATRVLLGAVAVNPWGVEDCAAALRNVLAMRPRERLARHAKDAEFLLRSTTAKWAYRVLQDLKAIAKDENRLHATHAGLGLGFRILGMRSGFDALAVDRVARAYRGACQNECAGGSRLIVLDYGGTLVPDAAADVVDPVAAYAIAKGEKRSPKPARDVVVVLDALCRDPRNVVFVVSGRERVDLLDGLCGRDENANLGLAAEHGFFVRWPKGLRDHAPEFHAAAGSPKVAEHRALVDRGEALAAAADAPPAPASSPPGSPKSAKQAELVREEDWDLAVPAHARHADDWRAPTLALMEMFAQRTQGTYVETHESCLVWQYRDADPDYGEMQAAELEAQLRVVLTPFASQVSVLRGENPSRGGYVEARPAGMDKGALLQRVLRALDAAGRPADFALVVGDDASDEPMFDALHRWLAPAGQAPARFKGRAFSVCMGKKPSGAESYVDTHDNLVELLQALARVSNRGARYYSSHDFSEQYAPPPAPARPPPVAEGEPDSPPTPADAAPGAAFGRSLSMPAFAAVNAPPRPRRAPKSKVPSWVSFQDAFKLPGVAAPGEAPIPEDSNDENQEEDDAAMFF